MTDYAERTAAVRAEVAKQRAKLPKVNSQGRPVKGHTLEYVRERWGHPKADAHIDARQHGEITSVVIPEYDGTLTRAEREAATQAESGAMRAAQQRIEALSQPPAERLRRERQKLDQ